MATKNADREGAILKALDALSCERAWRVAEHRANAAKYDGIKNDSYWAGSAERLYNETITIIKEVGGPHTDYVTSHFVKLTEIHVKNLLKANNNA